MFQNVAFRNQAPSILAISKEDHDTAGVLLAPYDQGLLTTKARSWCWQLLMFAEVARTQAPSSQDDAYHQLEFPPMRLSTIAPFHLSVI